MRKPIHLLPGLATLAVLMVNVPTSARAEPYRHAVPALLVTEAPAAETVLPDRISPPTNTAIERIAAPMIELAQPRPRPTRAGFQLASLGRSDIPTKRSSITEGAVRWGASPSCLDSRLRQVINQVASIFGPVKLNSTCRSRTHNAKVGGATRSKHLTGDAVDFSVSHNKPAVLGWLRRQPSVGGLKLYAGGRGHFHIDTGPRRTW
jgi:Peptidase M15